MIDFFGRKTSDHRKRRRKHADVKKNLNGENREENKRRKRQKVETVC